MIGAIGGDIIGSIYEGRGIKTKDFPLFAAGCRFTDDTVLTAAVARAILRGEDYAVAARALGRRYPHAGYGAAFFRWLLNPGAGPYNSWGNGAAMRVSPVGLAFNEKPRVLDEARRSAVITHNHPEGIRGAQATALAVWMARKGRRRSEIRTAVQENFGYDLARSLAEIRPGYRFDVSCQGSVPEALIAFLESDSYEDAVRNAVWLGGDSDTMACIAGAVAEAFYGGVPRAVAAAVREHLPDDLWEVTRSFCRRFYPASLQALEAGPQQAT